MELWSLLKKWEAHSYPTIAGWWLTYPSEKYEFVSWDDRMIIPN
jgi:hypothetical protein